MTIDKIYTEEIPERIFCRAMRILITTKLNGAYGSHTTNEGHAALKRALEDHYPDEINSFENEQLQIAEKRIARTNERLDKLKS